MNKKIILIVIGIIAGLVVLGITLIVPILMLFDFFGANVTDDYVEDNMQYADQYHAVLNNNITNGYVPLKRILYFYLTDDKLTFDEIYKDNLNKDNKKMLPISEVCNLDKYKKLEVCNENELANSGQLNQEQNKPLGLPIDFSKITITSFFMEERVVFSKADHHNGWDLATENHTPVLAVCDGTISKVSFEYMNNVTNTEAGGGNEVVLDCVVDNLTYKVTYAHLYPLSSKVTQGQTVTQGQQLAEVGTTGYSTGPHLHFQVNLNGRLVDGMSLINFQTDNP